MFCIAQWCTWSITMYLKALFWLNTISTWHLQFKRIKVFCVPLVTLSAKGENEFHRNEITEIKVTQGDGNMELGNI